MLECLRFRMVTEALPSLTSKMDPNLLINIITFNKLKHKRRTYIFLSEFNMET